MDNNIKDNLQQPTTPTNPEATPIADGLKKDASKKKSNKWMIVLAGVLVAGYITLTVLYNFNSTKLSALSSFVPHFKKSNTVDSSTLASSSTFDTTGMAAMDTLHVATDTTSKNAVAQADSAKKETTSIAQKETKAVEQKVAAATKTSVEKSVTKIVSKKMIAESYSASTVSAKKQAVEPTVKKEVETKSSSNNTIASSENVKAEKSTSSKITSSKNAIVSKSKFTKKNDDYAVYHTDNSYTIPAGQASSSKEYPTYKYKTNPNEVAAVAKPSNYYVSYNTSEARFIKASKPYPKNFDEYLKSIPNGDIDYDTRFAFSERCLQTYFVPGAQAQQVDETGKIMNTLSMEDLFGFMRVNEFGINVKEKQQSGSRLSGIKFSYKF